MGQGISGFFPDCITACQTDARRSSIMGFMGPFGDFMLAKFLLRTPENQTVAVGLQTFISDVTNQRVSFAAGAILIALPICLLFFFYKRTLLPA